MEAPQLSHQEPTNIFLNVSYPSIPWPSNGIGPPAVLFVSMKRPPQRLVTSSVPSETIGGMLGSIFMVFLYFHLPTAFWSMVCIGVGFGMGISPISGFFSVLPLVCSVFLY